MTAEKTEKQTIVQTVKTLARHIHALVTHRIWVMNFSRMNRWRAFGAKVLKIVLIVINDFFKDRITLRAASLTYSSLLAIVPLFAVMFSVLKGFGFQNKILEVLMEKLTANQASVAQNIIHYINNARVETLGAVGAGALLLTAVGLFSGIEKSFNDIWGIKTGRPFIRTLTDYLFIIMVCPIFISVAVGMSAGNLVGIPFVREIMSVPFVHSFLYGLYPFISMWIILTLAYMVLVNTKVKFTSAFLGGVIAGSAWQITQSIYIGFAAGINKYSIIFGSFAQPILAFIWLDITWMIVLVGAQFVFAIQNYNFYQAEGKHVDVSWSLREKLTLVILYLVLSRFKKAEQPMTSDEIVAKTQLPIKIVNEILRDQVEIGVLVAAGNVQKCYTPAVDLRTLTVPFVMAKTKSLGINEVQIEEGVDEHKVEKLLKKIDVSFRSRFRNIRIADL
jgi:membrane protein